MSDDEIKTPNCPNCGATPAVNFFTPFFCPREKCHVVSWEPTVSLAELRAADPKMLDMDELFELKDEDS